MDCLDSVAWKVTVNNFQCNLQLRVNITVVEIWTIRKVHEIGGTIEGLYVYMVHTGFSNSGYSYPECHNLPPLLGWKPSFTTIQPIYPVTQWPVLQRLLNIVLLPGGPRVTALGGDGSRVSVTWWQSPVPPHPSDDSPLCRSFIVTITRVKGSRT